MTQNLIALLGIAGVGKSTLLRELSAHLSFQHLQASALIIEGRQQVKEGFVSVDNLRTADIDENQQFLTSGYLKAVDPDAAIVILDGHSVIDTHNGLVLISPSVFARLGIQRIIFLADDPSAIILRRNGDSIRNRPVRSEEEILKYQDAAILNASRISLKLGIPLIVVAPKQRDQILHALCNT